MCIYFLICNRCLHTKFAVTDVYMPCLLQQMCIYHVCCNRCVYTMFAATDVYIPCLLQQMCIYHVCCNRCVYTMFAATDVYIPCLLQQMCIYDVCATDPLLVSASPVHTQSVGRADSRTGSLTITRQSFWLLLVSVS